MRRNSPPTIMHLPLFIALLGVGFCAWSASGNVVNLCVTTGCALYQDAAVGGLSVWWIGTAAFALLLFVALLGRPWLGFLVGGICLLTDMLLLLLMLLTAPCGACLAAGLLFAWYYFAVRRCSRQRAAPLPRSRLLPAWGLLVVVNLLLLVRMETGTWAMTGPEDAAVSLYFSPSCSACREAVSGLSLRDNAAFYPLAETDADVPVIAAMHMAVRAGARPDQALAEAKPTDILSFWDLYSPEMLLLRFRLLRNKAHVFTRGGQVIPFVEIRGLPAGLTQKQPSRNETSHGTRESSSNTSEAAKDAALPLDDIAGSCGGSAGAPCP